MHNGKCAAGRLRSSALGIILPTALALALASGLAPALAGAAEGTSGGGGITIPPKPLHRR